MSGLTEIVHFLGMHAVVASSRMRELLLHVERVARTNAAVLITGESGCGKELVARAIHHFSLRASKPWVDVSCGALPEHLMESELFGYEKGAFSGAESQKPGLFELAHTGTLFLDEIGELEPRMQVKLLRVLDGVSYYRLGGLRKVSVDVRILAASNQNLEAAMRHGNLRHDLYHRLNQIQIQVPPLRDRVDDVVPIAEFFLRQQCPTHHFSLAAQTTLCRYNWPGNVRELRNAVVQASIAAKDCEIQVEDLPVVVRGGQPLTGREPTGDLDELERRMILEVLAKTGGHHEKAAEVLGISRRTLSRKMKIYKSAAPVETCA
jgi:transcriptional regulator with PAS, ATPase and Fis domain